MTTEATGRLLPGSEHFCVDEIPSYEASGSGEHLYVQIETEGVRPAVVVLTDAYYPGWEARVDGERVPLLRADFLFRGIAVSAGSHRIELDYRPGSLRLGLAFAGSSLFVFGAAAWRERRRSSGAD